MKRTTPSEAIERLREAKSELRRERIAMSLPEKVRQVVKLQQFHVTATRRRRPLEERERVWNLRDR